LFVKENNMLQPYQMLPGRKSQYSIESFLDTGGFATLYRARAWQVGLPRYVAVKEIQVNGLEMSTQRIALHTFIREVELLGTLAHPRLPRLYDSFVAGDYGYLVLDLIDGVTLTAYQSCYRGALPLQEVLEIGVQLCEILSYLHHQQPPVIHGDLKPSNILLTCDEGLFLLDFGIARRYVRNGPGEDALGSPGYCAPEQYKGKATPQSDIYSLGVLLTSLLTGRVPTRAGSDVGTVLRRLVLNRDPLRAEFDRLLQRMLSKEGVNRPPVEEVMGYLQWLAHAENMGTRKQRNTQPDLSAPKPVSYGTVYLKEEVSCL
jgi:serine/threonine protein kinase